MIESAIVNGECVFKKGDIVKINIRYKEYNFTNKNLFEGKIIKIDDNRMLVDCSSNYESNKIYFEFKSIVNITKIKNDI